MPNIACGENGWCPYEYSCSNNLCVHNSAYPVSGYPIFIYCLYPIASAICNTSGNSFGEFKVLLLMDTLDYSESEATTLCYPLILGTALYNVIHLIFKRHPYKPTSLVDYNIVMIIIPCVLYGSTIGSLINNFIPPIVADCLIIVLLVAFSTKFFLRLRGLFQKAKEEEAKQQNALEIAATVEPQSVKQQPVGQQLNEIQPPEDKLSKMAEEGTVQHPVIHHHENKNRPYETQMEVIEQMIELGVVPQTIDVSLVAEQVQRKRAETYKWRHTITENLENQLSESSDNSNREELLHEFEKNTDRAPSSVKRNQTKKSWASRLESKRKTYGTGNSKLDNPFQIQLMQQLKYEEGYHMQNVGAILVIFAIFESCAFLAQGKIIHFGFCSSYYGLGLGLLSIFFIAVMFGIYVFTRKKLKHYQRIQFQYEYPLDRIKYFGLICAGSFLGGLNGGVFAIGNSTTIIFTLLYLQVEPIVVSATVGFQVVFAAAASLCQAIARDQIPIDAVIFFFLLTCVCGGILSYIAGRLVARLHRDRVNMVLVGIVACLTCASALSMVVNIGLGFSNFGAKYMTAADVPC